VGAADGTFSLTGPAWISELLSLGGCPACPLYNGASASLRITAPLLARY
jgi:hypothetical protein